MPAVKRRRDVVTCFVRHRDRILLVKRSGEVHTFRGKWAGISGSMDCADPLGHALQEIREEVGLERDAISLRSQGEPLVVLDDENQVEWRVHPFLFDLRADHSIRLGWEHSECKWVRLHELENMDTVPKLEETWERLWRR